MADVIQGANIGVADPLAPGNTLKINPDGSINVDTTTGPGAGAGSTKQVTVDNSGTTVVVAARADRIAVMITNLGTTDVYLGFATGLTTGTGDLLPGIKGASVTIPTTAEVFGVVAAASQAVSVMEIY